MEDQPEPQIWVRVARKGAGGIAFTVEDNGIGIDEDQLHTIWNRGISGRQSSGPTTLMTLLLHWLKISANVV